MIAFATASLLAVRLWELAIFAIWLVGLLGILRLDRNELLLGVYVGATLTIFWDWICGSPYLFNIPHYDHRFLGHLWTIQGRTEPLWVAFAQGPFFGLPAVLALNWGWLRERGNFVLYLLLGAAVGASDYIIEGISVGTLHLYKYTYNPANLFVGVPWEVVFVYVPLCIAVTCFLVVRVARVIRLAGLAGPAGPAESAGSAGSANATATARDQRIGLWLGVVIPIAALYPGAWALALLNGAIHPLGR
ncbi:MAG: hypothetical protein ACYDHH_30835 [Solirubrobacteraceae bacterium]